MRISPPERQEAPALAYIQAHPGVNLSELLATYSDLAVNIIWTLLSTRRVFTDLSATLLMRHEQVRLYAEEGQVPRVQPGESPALPPSLPSAPLAWGGRLWWIERLEDVVDLRPEVGEPLTLPRAEFERLKGEGTLWIVGAASPSPMTPEVRQLLALAMVGQGVCWLHWGAEATGWWMPCKPAAKGKGAEALQLGGYLRQKTGVCCASLQPVLFLSRSM